MIKCLESIRILNKRPTYALEITWAKVAVPSFLRFDLILTNHLVRNVPRFLLVLPFNIILRILCFA